jgi:hypothetical protein
MAILTLLIALIGAVSGPLSLAWLIRSWARDRVDLRLTASLETAWVPRFDPTNPKRLPIQETEVWVVRLGNHRAREVQVHAIGVEWSDGAESVLRVDLGPALPLTLKEGQGTEFSFGRAITGASGCRRHCTVRSGRAWPKVAAASRGLPET